MELTKTFKKEYKQALYELLDFTDFISFVNMEKLAQVVDKLDSIEFNLEIFSNFYKESKEVRRIFEKAYATASYSNSYDKFTELSSI